MSLDERVVALAEAAGLFVEAQRASGSVTVSWGDVKMVLSDRSGDFTVERVERGVVEAVDLATRSFQAVERFVVLMVGPSWRAREGLPWLRVPVAYSGEDPGPLPPGMTASPDDGYTVLTWRGLDGPQAARLFARSDAYALAWALTASLEDVFASFKDAEGRPLFPQERKRRWTRR